MHSARRRIWLRGGECVVIDVTDTGDPRDRDPRKPSAGVLSPAPPSAPARTARVQPAPVQAARKPARTGRPSPTCRPPTPRSRRAARYAWPSAPRTCSGSPAALAGAPEPPSPAWTCPHFGRVLSVDPQTRTAVTGGMTTYEDLVDATLQHGLMPLVVPQLKTITIGGAVTGLASSPVRCAAACRTNLCSRWRSSPATGGWSRPLRATSMTRSTAASRTPTARSATRSR